MTATNINISTDGALAEKAQSVLENLGLDMTTAMNLFLTQVVDRGALPFEVTDKADRVKPVRKMPKLGGGEGKIWMAEDFDAPLMLVPDPDYVKQPPRKVPQLGCMEGEIWMAEDFDAPLEDFKEYM